MKNIFLFIALLNFFALEAQIAPKYSNEFLRLGVGARAMSMGGAVLSSCNNVFAGYWNPAQLTELDKMIEVGYMHSEYFAGLASYDYFGAAYQIDDQSALGLTFIRFGVDNIPNTLELYDDQGNLRYDRISYFSAIDNAVLLSYAKKSAVEGLNIGANVKIIRRTTGEFASSWGFGIDLAAAYSKNGWNAGLNLRDVTSTFNAWDFNEDKLSDAFALTGNELPENALELTLPSFQFGIGRRFKTEKEISISPELAFAAYFDGQQNTIISSSVVSIDPYIGIEIDYRNLLYVRGGVNRIQKVQDFDKERISVQPNMGLGLKFSSFNIDYAISNFGNDNLNFYSHIFSVTYSFNSFPGL